MFMETVPWTLANPRSLDNISLHNNFFTDDVPDKELGPWRLAWEHDNDVSYDEGET